MSVTDWLLDGDPAIRWQVLRDLTDAVARRGRRRAGAGRARGLGRPPARGRGSRRAVGRRRLLPGGYTGDEPGQPWTATMHTLQTLQLLGLDPTSDVGPPVDRARRRERALGARRAALLRRRGRAVHQRPHDRDRRLLRRGRRADRRAGPRRAAGRRRLELRGRERLGALVVRHHDQRARRAARVRAGDRRVGGGDERPARRRGVPARAQPVPPQEHRRGRRPGVPRVRLPVLLALRRAARPRLLPPGRRRPRPSDGGGGRGRAVEAAARRPLAARPHPPRSRPLRPRGAASARRAAGTPSARSASSTGGPTTPAERPCGGITGSVQAISMPYV